MSTKRSRKALQLQERLATIEFWEENQQIPIKAIGKKFAVPRTTIYGSKEKDVLKNLTKGQTRSRDFTVTNQKITAQAFGFHRMLSGQVSEPLPPYYLERFSENLNDDWWRYTNATCLRKRLYTNGKLWLSFCAKDIDAGVTDWTTSELIEWPNNLDKKLERTIVLVMDLSIWNLLPRNNEARSDLQEPFASLRPRFKNIVPVKMPEIHAATHLMTTGLAKEFKLLYLSYILDLNGYEGKRRTLLTRG
ncbi:MAG: hypothetical protein J3Q66DRAFT_416161 [Benniella sp.]|nr:MAG: hypothetical protein J3Q66DRAFT_416161 [Benniella sp.]